MFRIIYKLYQKKKSIVSYNIIKYCVDCVVYALFSDILLSTLELPKDHKLTGYSLAL